MPRTTRTTRSHRLVICGMLLTPLLSACTTPAAAPACAAATVTLSSTRLHAGEDVTVTGENFIKECLDTGQGTSPPATKIPIIFDEIITPRKELSVVDADSTGHIEASVTIPADASMGDAHIRVGADTTILVEIVAEWPPI